jgi:transcriptional regulator with XRE-family HTH domain
MARASATTARKLQRRLGLRIQSLRRDRALTQEALAAECGLSQKYLSELERGAKSPSWETLLALAHDGFRIKLAALVSSIDEDLALEAREVQDLLAGRSPEARYELLRAVELLLRASERK